MAMAKDTWNDISVETYREYVYSDYILRIEKPLFVMVSNSSFGGHAHRVQTKDVAYYIPPGWKAIRWGVAEGNPLFKY